MKSLRLVLLGFGAVACAGAEATERAIIAAMRLGEQRSYSWTTTVVDDARSYVIEGKTQRGGFTWVRLPMVPAVGQRLGREADTEIEAIFQGCQHAVIWTERGWRTLQELPKRRAEWNDDLIVWQTRSRGPLWENGSLGLQDPFEFPPVALPQPGNVADESDRQPYSNAQFGLAHPHEELAVIVSSHANLTVRGDVVTGTLTDTGAQLLLVRDGQDHITPVCAAGAFKLIVKQGIVTRYLLRLEGILLVDRKQVRARQVSNTTIVDIGRTQFDVPEEARVRLAAR